jgi:mannose-6-phosphate isomerase-like protein (cupin superfamily)
VTLGWSANIESETLGNTTFRTVLFTGTQTQLTVMHLQAGEEIGLEAHDDTDQFIRVEEGFARVTMGRAKGTVDDEHVLEDDWAVIIPAGVWHNVINTGDGPLKLYSLYSPPEHPDGTVHPTKADADAAETEHGN